MYGSSDTTLGKRTQRLNINNFFIKGYYDPSDDLKMEFSYTYAPTTEHRFNSQTPSSHTYDWKSGGHQVGNKIMWSNPLGLLTSTLSYSYLHNSATTNGFVDTKYWHYSATKNWANQKGWQNEGGQAEQYSSHHTFNEKLVQDLEPFSSVSPYA